MAILRDMGSAPMPEEGEPRRAPPAPVAALLLLGLALSGCVVGTVVGVGESPTVEGRVSASGHSIVVAIVDESGEPLSGALVTVSDQSGTRRVVSDDVGLVRVPWNGGPVTIVAEASGLLPAEALVVERPRDVFSLTMYPVVMRGVVTDPEGRPLTGALITSGSNSTSSKPNGTFELPRAIPGEVVAARPARATTRARWDGDRAPLEIALPPLVVKALHVGPAAAADPTQWDELVSVADASVVNGLVIDLKDDSGRVYYDSEVELARAAGAVMKWFTLGDLLADVQKHDLYAIARISAFLDPLAARAMPGIAVWDLGRDAPFVSNGQWYLDPSDEQARGYAIELAVEACRAGFDEIQLDHVAFPGSASPDLLFDAVESEEDRAVTLRGFIAEAAAVLIGEGCALAVDVLGSALTVKGAGAVGQDFPSLSEAADVVSPTIYPSHYSEGWFGLEDPSSRPGVLVAAALDDGLERIAGPAVLRPWLQDFSYGTAAVVAQIEATEARGLGWMLWNGQSTYTVQALEPEETQSSGGAG